MVTLIIKKGGIIMENTNTFRILFYIRKTKTLKNDQAPSYVQITIAGSGHKSRPIEGR